MTFLEATDGPMLRHGLQEVHGTRLLLPPVAGAAAVARGVGAAVAGFGLWVG